jgi:hypothetical protein
MISSIVKVESRRLLVGYKGLFVMLLIVALSSSVSAQAGSPSKILLTFSRQMSRENIFDPANYKVTANENIPVEIIKVGLVKGDSSVVLFFNKEAGWLSLQITVKNLKDKAGNFISNEKNFAEIILALHKNTPVTILSDK